MPAPHRAMSHWAQESWELRQDDWADRWGGRGPRGRHWGAPSRGGSVQTDDSRVNSVTHPAGLCCKLLFAFLIYFKQKSINSITICICWNVSWREEAGAIRQSGVFPAPSDHRRCSVPPLVSDLCEPPSSFLFTDTKVTLRRLSTRGTLKSWLSFQSVSH